MSNGDESPRQSGNLSAASPHDVQDRRQLVGYLNAGMPSEYREFSPDGELTQHSTFVKSYIVERHQPLEQSGSGDWSAVFPEVHRRKDESLLLLVTASGDSFFADIGDTRFVVLHSIAKAAVADRVIEQLTQGEQTGFDRAWLPSDFLLGQRQGKLRGFKFGHQKSLDGIAQLGFDNTEFNKGASRTSPEEGTELEEVGMELELVRDSLRSRMAIANSSTAESDLTAIRVSNIFEGRRALDSIEFVSVARQDERVVSGTYSFGKIVGSGSSASMHLVIVGGILASYRHAIKRVEEEFWFGWKQENRAIKKSGYPILIMFPGGLITDLRAFVSSLFNSQKPFRLFGIPHRVTDLRVDVEAIDLHTMDPLAFEITSEWMRIYLPFGSCGNIVARLLTNFQHSAHSDVIALSPSTGEHLFSEEAARGD